MQIKVNYFLIFLSLQEIISEGLGMFIQVTNIIVVVVLPVIIIHLKGHLFSLSKFFK